MYDHILVPTDGSSGTTKTLDHASSLARANDATVHVLYVIDKRLYRAAEDDAKDSVRRSLDEEGDRAIDAAVAHFEDEGIDVISAMREGIPHKTILEYAAEADVDLIAMGTHGRTGRDRLANLGSVTERVVKNTTQPVLVVNIDEE
jgi:nucleotide-binding universal stress UspA family protein